MEFRCSPYIPLIFVGILGILIFCSLPSSAQSQCNDDFTYQAFSPDPETSSGRIEISIENPQAGIYTFKVFKVAEQITLVQTREVSSTDKIFIEGLKPGSFLVKIEWGEKCYKTLGGLDGILITRKDRQDE